MITFSPERQNLWQNWIDNCFFIETFGLWTKSVSEDTQKAIETHTHTRERRQKNALLGSSFFFRFRWHSSPTSQALSLSLSVFDILYYSPRLLLDRLFWDILSGHTAVNIGKSKVVVFGGLVDKKFLSDIVVYDVGTIFFFISLCS